MQGWGKAVCVAAAAVAFASVPIASGAASAEGEELALLPGSPFDVTVTDIADGVFVAERSPFWRFPVVGNAVVIIGNKSVAVFDGGGGAQFAQGVLDAIRARTQKPISHVILSHEHSDHVWGIDRLTRSSPDIKFIAHPNAAEGVGEDMAAALERRAAGFTAFFEQAKTDLAANAEGGVPMQPVDRLYKRQAVSDASAILEEAKTLTYDTPNLAVADATTIDLGGRIVEIRHLGFGDTDGDLVAWLPEERILLAGDIVSHPMPFGFGVRSRETIRTMAKLVEYDFETLVIGHGAIQTDDVYLKKVIAMYSGVNDEIERLHKQGLDAAAIRNEIDFDRIAAEFSEGDAVAESFFRRWFVSIVVESSLAELTSAGSD